MTSELFIKIVSAIITIIVALITTFLIPWIKSKFTASQLAQIKAYTEMAVRCAEQIFTPEEYERKKEYVYNYICDVISDKIKINLTPQDINTLIESAVNQIKYSGDYSK